MPPTSGQPDGLRVKGPNLAIRSIDSVDWVDPGLRRRCKKLVRLASSRPGSRRNGSEDVAEVFELKELRAGLNCSSFMAVLPPREGGRGQGPTVCQTVDHSHLRGTAKPGASGSLTLLGPASQVLVPVPLLC